MTNSKQHCDYCGERWSALHSACRPHRRPQLRPMRRLFDAAGTRLSTVRVENDRKLFEVSPLTATTFATEAEWRAAYPTGTEVRDDPTTADKA